MNDEKRRILLEVEMEARQKMLREVDRLEAVLDMLPPSKSEHPLNDAERADIRAMVVRMREMAEKVGRSLK